MSAIPNHKVFTVRRAYSNGLFTIRVNDKPSVVAFRDKKSANKFMSMERSMWAGPQQPLCVDHMSLPSLMRRCSMNALTVTVINIDCGGVECETYSQKQQSVDEMQFHFEHVLKYMSS